MPFSWEVPFLVVVIVASIVYFAGRTKRERDSRPAVPLTGDAFIDRIQQTLGMAIMVESVEPAELGAPDEPSGPTTIRAALMYGQHTTEVGVTADTEAKAWEELARVATAWRNSDRQHIQMWPGAGG